MGIFDAFKSKPLVKEIGNLNCISIGGKFDTGHKVDNKALFKYLKENIKKNTLKKEFTITIKEKIINEDTNEANLSSVGKFYIPSNQIDDGDEKSAETVGRQSHYCGRRRNGAGGRWQRKGCCGHVCPAWCQGLLYGHQRIGGQQYRENDPG